MKIIDTFKSFSVSKLEYEEYYSSDENVCLRLYESSLHIKDLTNSMKTGKTVTLFRIIPNTDNFKIDFINYLIENSLTIFDIITSLIKGYDLPESDDFLIKTSELKGVKVFSPFVVPKPIKLPKKWTLSHVAKAILTGQIAEGECTGYYTDDYLGDDERNYGKGKIDLMEFCQDIIEESLGWKVCETSKINKDGCIALSVNCFSYDFNTLYFNINGKREIKKTEIEENPIVIDLIDYKIKRKL